MKSSLLHKIPLGLFLLFVAVSSLAGLNGTEVRTNSVDNHFGAYSKMTNLNDHIDIWDFEETWCSSEDDDHDSADLTINGASSWACIYGVESVNHSACFEGIAHGIKRFILFCVYRL